MGLIRAHQQWIAIYHSTDDPHIPAREPRYIAAQLKCSYFEFGDRGHFVDADALPAIVPFSSANSGPFTGDRTRAPSLRDRPRR